MIVARHPAAAGLPGTGPIKNPSRKERCDPYARLISRPDRSTPIGPNHTVPSGTGPVFAWIPGNKLPGYDHMVPPGQTLLLLKLTRMRGLGCLAMIIWSLRDDIGCRK